MDPTAIVAAASQLIQQVGFPIVVCGWFMFRAEKLLKEQTDVLTKIAVALGADVKKEG